jgi:hypothetical protein
MATITRSAVENGNSGSFYQPIEVLARENGRVVVYPQGGSAQEGFEFWPDEAEKLALAILRLVYRRL